MVDGTCWSSFVESCFALNAGGAFYVGLRSLVDSAINTHYQKIETKAATSEEIKEHHRDVLMKKIRKHLRVYDRRQKITFKTFRVFSGVMALVSLGLLYTNCLEGWCFVLLAPLVVCIPMAYHFYRRFKKKSGQIWEAYAVVGADIDDEDEDNDSDISKLIKKSFK